MKKKNNHLGGKLQSYWHCIEHLRPPPPLPPPTMNLFASLLSAWYMCRCSPLHVDAFISTRSTIIIPSHSHAPTRHVTHHSNTLPPLSLADELSPEPIAVTINTTLSDTNTKKLFAWIKCAFDYDEDDKNDVYAYYYNNIELAIAAAFGDNLPENSLPSKLLDMAMKKEGLLDETGMSAEKAKDWEEKLVGDVIGRRDRESASLGAMGAAQWTGQWMTRPHCKYYCISVRFCCLACEKGEGVMHA